MQARQPGRSGQGTVLFVWAVCYPARAEPRTDDRVGDHQKEHGCVHLNHCNIDECLQNCRDGVPGVQGSGNQLIGNHVGEFENGSRGGEGTNAQRIEEICNKPG